MILEACLIGRENFPYSAKQLWLALSINLKFAGTSEEIFPGCIFAFDAQFIPRLLQNGYSQIRCQELTSAAIQLHEYDKHQIICTQRVNVIEVADL